LPTEHVLCSLHPSKRQYINYPNGNCTRPYCHATPAFDSHIPNYKDKPGEDQCVDLATDDEWIDDITVRTYQPKTEGTKCSNSTVGFILAMIRCPIRKCSIERMVQQDHIYYFACHDFLSRTASQHIDPSCACLAAFATLWQCSASRLASSGRQCMRQLSFVCCGMYVNDTTRN